MKLGFALILAAAAIALVDAYGGQVYPNSDFMRRRARNLRTKSGKGKGLDTSMQKSEGGAPEAGPSQQTTVTDVLEVQPAPGSNIINGSRNILKLFKKSKKGKS